MWQKYEGEGESDLLTFKRTWELKTWTKRSDEPEVESVRKYFERDGSEKVRDIDLNVLHKHAQPLQLLSSTVLMQHMQHQFLQRVSLISDFC
jgi:hypothetical protein